MRFGLHIDFTQPIMENVKAILNICHLVEDRFMYRRAFSLYRLTDAHKTESDFYSNKLLIQQIIKFFDNIPIPWVDWDGTLENANDVSLEQWLIDANIVIDILYVAANLDYAQMKRENSVFAKELMEYVFHPERIERYTHMYHLEHMGEYLDALDL